MGASGDDLRAERNKSWNDESGRHTELMKSVSRLNWSQKSRAKARIPETFRYSEFWFLQVYFGSL